MNFKVFFPTGYQIKNETNDNLDLNVILENGEIFFCTVFTIENIHMLINADTLSFFWADSMVIVKDLSKECIRKFIKETIELESFNTIFLKFFRIET